MSSSSSTKSTRSRSQDDERIEWIIKRAANRVDPEELEDEVQRLEMEELRAAQERRRLQRRAEIMVLDAKLKAAVQSARETRSDPALIEERLKKNTGIRLVPGKHPMTPRRQAEWEEARERAAQRRRKAEELQARREAEWAERKAKEEEEYRKLDRIYRQQRESLSWQRVDPVVDPEPRREILELGQSYSHSYSGRHVTPTQPHHSSRWYKEERGDSLSWQRVDSVVDPEPRREVLEPHRPHSRRHETPRPPPPSTPAWSPQSSRRREDWPIVSTTHQCRAAARAVAPDSEIHHLERRLQEKSRLTQGEREVDKVISPEPAKHLTEVMPAATTTVSQGALSRQGADTVVGPEPTQHHPTDVMPVAAEEKRSEVGQEKKSQLQRWDNEEVDPKLAKRPAEPVPDVMPVATEENRSKVGQGKNSQLQRRDDEDVGPKLVKRPIEPVTEIMPIATEEEKGQGQDPEGQGKEGRLAPRERGDDKEKDPKLAKRLTDPKSEVMPVAADEVKGKEGQEKESRLAPRGQGDDKEIDPKLAKRPTEPASEVMPVATEEESSKEGQGKECQLRRGDNKEMDPKLAKRPTEPASEVIPVAMEKENRTEYQVEPPRADMTVGPEPAELSLRKTQWLDMRLAHIRQAAEEKDVLLYPWRPKAGLGAELTVHSCERMMEPPDRDVLLFPWCPDGGLDADKDVLRFPWWPDGALDGAGWSYWNTDDHCLECKVQATEGPMCGLSASCASLEASA